MNDCASDSTIGSFFTFGDIVFVDMSVVVSRRRGSEFLCLLPRLATPPVLVSADTGVGSRGLGGASPIGAHRNTVGPGAI